MNSEIFLNIKIMKVIFKFNFNCYSKFFENLHFLLFYLTLKLDKNSQQIKIDKEDKTQILSEIDPDLEIKRYIEESNEQVRLVWYIHCS